MSLVEKFLYSGQFTASILKSMHEGLLVLDKANRIATANEAALDFFGFSRFEDLYGRFFSELYVDEDGGADFIAILELEGILNGIENTFVRTDGQSFTGLYSATIIHDVENSEPLKLIFIQDITERRKSAEKLSEYTKLLEKSNKELNQFAYVVSHDLKAPLRAISNLSSWLMEDLGPELSGDNKSNLETLRGRVQRLDALINGILEYSKVGRESLAPEAIDTYGLLTEVLEMLSPPSHIKVELAPEMPVVESPKTLLFQVFSNLISNAIKYNDKSEGCIKISGVERGNLHEFVIEDNGPGIAPEYHEKIFVIFQTLQARDKFESTGIGLTIVKRIVEDRKGKIWVESELGKGSKFIFTWPRDSQEDKNKLKRTSSVL
jgi:PAS domain S-box-containing protein